MHPDHRRASHNGDHLLGFVGTALIPSLSPSQNEFPIPEHQNIIRLDEHLRITHMDDKCVVDLHRFSLSMFVTVSHRLQRTLNWNLAYMTSSLYLYVHPDDLSSLIAAHRDCKYAAVKNRSRRSNGSLFVSSSFASTVATATGTERRSSADECDRYLGAAASA